jgi:septum formation protein
MALWLASTPLILASRSPARRALLTAAGVPVEVRPADLDERALKSDLGASSPAEIAKVLALKKASAVAAQRPGRLIVGADQTLALNAQRLTKPLDRADARRQLASLAGRTHELYSALAVVCDETVRFAALGVARVTMRAFSPACLNAYLELAGNAVTTSVGGYQVEGLGVQLVEHIEGDHCVVLGLPLLPLLEFLRKHGSLRA